MPLRSANPTTRFARRRRSWSPIRPGSAAPILEIRTCVLSTTGINCSRQGDAGLGGSRLPHRRDRLHRVQGEDGRSSDRVDCANPRTPSWNTKSIRPGCLRLSTPARKRRATHAQETMVARPRSSLRLGKEAQGDFRRQQRICAARGFVSGSAFSEQAGARWRYREVGSSGER